MGVLRVKNSSVKFDRIAPAGFRILRILEHIASTEPFDLVITSACDSHTSDDPHFRGEGYDVSLDTIPSPKEVLDVLLQSRVMLGPLFTVLLEAPKVEILPLLLKPYIYLNPKASGPHFHFQPKKGTKWPPAAGGTVSGG